MVSLLTLSEIWRKQIRKDLLGTVADSNDVGESHTRLNCIRSQPIVYSSSCTWAEDPGIPLQVFVQNLSWHPVPDNAHALQEAAAESRRNKQAALAEFYHWQLRGTKLKPHPSSPGARSTP